MQVEVKSRVSRVGGELGILGINFVQQFVTEKGSARFMPVLFSFLRFLLSLVGLGWQNARLMSCRSKAKRFCFMFGLLVFFCEGVLGGGWGGVKEPTVWPSRIARGGSCLGQKPERRAKVVATWDRKMQPLPSL